jgi:glycosyltransferase involved in cell wall biosynthesis
VISVIIPCRNEKQHVEACVLSLLEQENPPGGLEIIVVDGLSDDGTREVLKELTVRHSRLRIVDNPGRVTPRGMNLGIRAARGRYVAILGAHCSYAPNYLRACSQLLDEHPEVACVGGPIISIGKTPFGKAVASAMSHPVGIGNAKHRHPDYEGYAEGACYPVFRKEIFDTIGFYDETLVRNQDDELNYRLAKSGGKIFISPRARCLYFVRETVRGLFQQYCQYGYWRVAVLRKHRLPASLRQLVPPLFMSCMLAGVITGLFLPGLWAITAGALPLFYGGALFVVGVSAARTAGWRSVLLFPVAAAVMHSAYALGFMKGIMMIPHRSMRNIFGKGECHVSGT